MLEHEEMILQAIYAEIDDLMNERARLTEKNIRLRELVQTLLDNDPADLAADGGITVFDVWCKEARQVLAQI